MTISKPISEPISKPIILIGMMGAGKTTIGQLLAQQLKLAHIDSDDLIEKQENQSISALFAEKGEDYFRQKEREIIDNLLKPPFAYGVISLGGGAFIQDDIRKLCAQKALSIWLQVSLETIMARLSADKSFGTRPLLTNPLSSRNLSQSQIRSQLEHLIQHREPIYAKADIVIKENIPEKMVNMIMAHLTKRRVR